MKKTMTLAVLAGALATSAAQAESLVDGVYLSQGDENGKGVCTLSLKSLDQDHKYGDEVFELESNGDGACEWTALGISKSYAITGGMVTNGGTPAFVKLSFPFGPAGKRIELTTFDVDGTVRNSDIFHMQEDILVGE